MNMDHTRAQSTLEFTFAMILVVFLIYGMVRVFFWVGKDLANRRIAQDNSLVDNSMDASVQLNPDFYRVQSMDAIYNGTVANEGAN